MICQDCDAPAVTTGRCRSCYTGYRYVQQHPDAKHARYLDVDEVVIERLVLGERVECNILERRAAVHRLNAAGMPRAAIARHLGIHARQVYRDLLRQK